jgi:hypothetical protein
MVPNIGVCSARNTLTLLRESVIVVFLFIEECSQSCHSSDRIFAHIEFHLGNLFKRRYAFTFRPKPIEKLSKSMRYEIALFFPYDSRGQGPPVLPRSRRAEIAQIFPVCLHPRPASLTNGAGGIRRQVQHGDAALDSIDSEDFLNRAWPVLVAFVKAAAFFFVLGLFCIYGSECYSVL